MTQRSIMRVLSVACVGLIFVFMAETVEAQRRGGGGRGGGGAVGEGTYVVTLEVGGKKLTKPLQVLQDRWLNER